MLRPWVAPDAPSLVESYADPDIQQWHARTMTLPEAQEWIRAKAEGWVREFAADWAVEAEGRVVGRVGFRWISLGTGCAELAYWTHPQARGRGHSSAAVRTLTDWAFGAGLHRIHLRHAVANRASCRVAERCGFDHEGTEISAMLHSDGWHDMHVHAMVNQREEGPGQAASRPS